ncbi:MAG TPA: hypothetical protein VFX02_01890 [Gammaproteobacteria bacterium]|nr:hypothetical protein [Gammaproteobacteria bacterium]
MQVYPFNRSRMVAGAFAVALVAGLAACGQEEQAPPAQISAQPQSHRQGWSHNCTMDCTNVSVNRSETVERPGRTAAGPICSGSRQSCEAMRSVACANAVATANNETLYDDCHLVSEGECVEGCTFPPY